MVVLGPPQPGPARRPGPPQPGGGLSASRPATIGQMKKMPPLKAQKGILSGNGVPGHQLHRPRGKAGHRPRRRARRGVPERGAAALAQTCETTWPRPAAGGRAQCRTHRTGPGTAASGGAGGAGDRAIWQLSGGQRQRVGIARPWPPSPACSCWTSPSAPWTPSPGSRCRLCCCACGTSTGVRCCSSPTTSRRPSSWPPIWCCSPLPWRVTERLTLDFGRRFAAGEPCRSIKSDPAFIERREYVLERVFAEREAFA